MKATSPDQFRTRHGRRVLSVQEQEARKSLLGSFILFGIALSVTVATMVQL